MTKAVIFLRTKRYFPEAKYWFLDAVVRDEALGDVVITRESQLPAEATEEDLARDIAIWYGVAADQFELGELKDLGNEAPMRAVDAPYTVPVKRSDLKNVPAGEVLASAQAE